MDAMYLDVDQAASYLGLSKSLLAKLRVSGGGPVFYKPARKVLYRRKELDDWMTSRARRTTNEILQDIAL